MTLYELTDLRLEALTNPDLADEDLEALAGIEMAIDEKVINIAIVIKGLLVEAEAYKAEGNRLLDEARAKTKRVEWLKGYLETHLDHPVKDIKAEITFRTSEAVKITNEDLIPFGYKKEVKTVSVDKVALKQALKDGLAISGAEIQTNRNVQIK